MKDDIPALDWPSMPLDGRVLIEASAGTGKTFTIGLIFLRLLLERGLRVEQIVVATFSERAARELRDRLRRRLLDAERALASDAELDDAAMQSWFAPFRSDETRRKRALRAVRIARADMDRAPIGTIHSWCQRVLRDFPLESGASLGTSPIVDETVLLRECLEDFWRRRFLAAAVADDLDSVIARGVDGLIRDVQKLFTTDARVLSLQNDSALAALVERLRQPQHVAILREWAADISLYKRSNAALRSRFTELIAVSTDGGDAIVVLNDCASIDSEQIGKQLSATGLRICTHETFMLIREARTRALEADAERQARARVLIAALEFCREEVPRRARRRDVKTYGMLIDGVHERLAGPSGGAFAETLFDAFPAALIDEFQDTDRRQFEIFDWIYRQRGFLAMIGDPKQAIYAFRGGDIAAYLAARETADEQFALTVNYRSSSPLLAAFNALYARTDGGFGSEAIRYRDVTAGGGADRKPLRHGTDVDEKPFALHCFADDGETGLGKLDERALDDCAERIVELLNDFDITIGDRRVEPGDIAVLVTKNDQVAELRRRLARRGVPCVGAGRDSVFRSGIARDLELVLYGVANAGDERAVRGALCTELLGFTLDDVRRWQSDGAAFERELLRFESWRDLARTRGVQALVHAIAAERAGALLAREDGERLLTDLRHLGELLAEDAQVVQGLESACVRLSSLRNSEEAGDEETMKARLVRFESDAARVKLLTVHAAKGLQFPIVFLPFAWRPQSQLSPILQFHDESGARCVDLGSAEYAANRVRAQSEEMQERLRLLYVALTRAQYAVHVYWAETKNGREAATAPALAALLQQNLGDGTATQMSARDGIRVVGPHADGFHSYKTDHRADETLAARSPLPAPRPFVWLHSFSSLTRRAALATAESAASDEIETVADTLLEAAAESDVQIADDATLLSLDAWRGRHFGNALHKILEEAESGPVWPDQRRLLHRHLAALGTREGRSIEAVGRMAERVRGTDLGDGLRLDALASQERVVEFEFQFPTRVRVSALRDICAVHGLGELIPASLADSAIDGMLTGFADLVFAHNGRFHILDYKTNWLGNSRIDYAPAPLQTAMDEHHYGLQALLYTVALHRYLRGRLADYSPERHLGESWYLFVRAVGLGDGLGIWRRHWPVLLVEALDAAFAGEVEEA
jgi:exodeoxyribonuclease V beta subunit